VAASRWTVNESTLVNQSTLTKDLVNSGPTGYFTLYLAGGSSIGTLNCLKRKESSGGSSSPTKQFLEIPRNNKLKGIKYQS